MNDIDSSQTERNHLDETPSAGDVVEADDLIEEVSIDGMCGVY
ncbi:mycofactocin precursor MftA [Streptomyces viridosporus]|nr:mycofactocin precursor MftA [Streptomyces viridosporus]